jgi:hypothetical protein
MQYGREECQCNSVKAKAIWEFNFGLSSQSQLLIYIRLESDPGLTQQNSNSTVEVKKTTLRSGERKYGGKFQEKGIN